MPKGMVYIVDDSEEIRTSGAFLMQAEGYCCRAFPSGSDFLAALPELDPACILLDFRMPGLSGLEVLAKLRWMEIEWPVVMMTGHDAVNVAPAAMRHGAFDFLEKPFEGDLLMQILDRAFAFGRLVPRRPGAARTGAMVD